MNSEKHPPARRQARVLLATLTLLLLVLAGTQQARAQDAAAPAGKLKVKNYRVEELQLPSPVKVEVKGKRAEVSRAFRVTVTGGPFPVRALPAVVWIDDEPVGYGVESEDLDAITAVTFDD